MRGGLPLQPAPLKTSKMVCRFFAVCEIVVSAKFGLASASPTALLQFFGNGSVFASSDYALRVGNEWAWASRWDLRHRGQPRNSFFEIRQGRANASATDVIAFQKMVAIMAAGRTRHRGRASA